MITTVYVRFVYDSPYIDSFINHYKRLGFTNIIILFYETFLNDSSYSSLLDKNSIDYDVSRHLKSILNKKGFMKEELINDNSIVLHPVNNYKDKLIDNFKNIIPHETDWLLCVDSDEYLLINNNFATIDDLINKAVNTMSKIECIEFKWIFILNSIHCKNDTLMNLIESHNCYENKKITTDLVLNIKTLHKFNSGLRLTCHCAKGNRFTKNKYTVSNYFKGNTSIDKNISVNETSLGVLIHIRIRSFYNLLFKNINILKESCTSKNKALKEGNLINLLTKKKENTLDGESIFKKLYDTHILEYESNKHVNNISSKKEMIQSYFNNCLANQNECLINEKKEEDFYKEWFKNKLKDSKLGDSKIVNFDYNIEYCNNILKTLHKLEKMKNKNLNIFVEKVNKNTETSETIMKPK
jgi:hypothetical protein